MLMHIIGFQLGSGKILISNRSTYRSKSEGQHKLPILLMAKSSLRLLNSSGRWRGDQAVCSKTPSFAQWRALCPVPFPLNHIAGKQGAVGSQSEMGGSILGTPQLPFSICWPAICTEVQPQPFPFHQALPRPCDSSAVQLQLLLCVLLGQQSVSSVKS